ncbi:MAG: hypothetical protein O3A40_07285 [Bacteroidetes bacterium]|nr:hypothetical protein [Bacteroidota bacterium]
MSLFLCSVLVFALPEMSQGATELRTNLRVLHLRHFMHTMENETE